MLAKRSILRCRASCKRVERGESEDDEQEGEEPRCWKPVRLRVPSSGTVMGGSSCLRTVSCAKGRG